MNTVELTDKELAMVCDALFTTASSYSRDSQQFYRDAAERYRELANRIHHGLEKGHT